MDLRLEPVSARSGKLPPVLLVDDEEEVKRSVSRLLSSRFEVDTACDAQGALRKLFTRSYYAVITDFDMPGKDGIWLLGLARNLFPWVKRVLHSGSDPADVSSHVDSGLVQCFVEKAQVGCLLDSIPEP